MTPFILAFISLAVVLGIYGFVGLPLGSRLRRATISVLFAVVLAGLFFGYSDMLGRPKSTRFEVLHTGAKEATILGSYMVEGSGIYLWLQLPEAREPRYYMLPWDEKAAAALQRAIEDNAQHHGAGVDDLQGAGAEGVAGDRARKTDDRPTLNASSVLRLEKEERRGRGGHAEDAEEKQISFAPSA